MSSHIFLFTKPPLRALHHSKRFVWHSNANKPIRHFGINETGLIRDVVIHPSGSQRDVTVSWSRFDKCPELMYTGDLMTNFELEGKFCCWEKQLQNQTCSKSYSYMTCATYGKLHIKTHLKINAVDHKGYF